MASSGATVGVAMSGGGNRAACWAAGALLGLADAAMAPDIVSLSSVSGGSLTNGVVTVAGDLRTADREELTRWLVPGLRQWAHEGLFFPGPCTDRWVATTLAAAAAAIGGVAASAVATVACGRHASGPTVAVAGGATGVVLAAATAMVGRKALPAGPIRRSTILGAASGGVVTGAATGLATEWPLALLGLWPAAGIGVAAAVRRFGGRSRALVRAMETGPPYVAAALAAFGQRPVHHVFCTTDLSTGDNLYLTNRMVWGPPDLAATPGSVSVASAVQASACLPGAFLARTIDQLPCEPPAARKVVLSDGGVYDNMADQWESGFFARKERFAGTPRADLLHNAQIAAADQLVIVNASRGIDGVGAIRTDPGLAGELASALGAKDVLYDVSTAPRRRQLVERFDLAIEGEQARGAGFLVHIGTSPYAVVDRFADEPGVRQTRAATARTALDQLTDTTWPEVACNSVARRQKWRGLVDANAGVKTTLGPLESPRRGASADLLFHAFVLARLGAYVHLDRRPLPSSPDAWARSAFVDLIASAQT